jgi:hypothetical protein
MLLSVRSDIAAAVGKLTARLTASKISRLTLRACKGKVRRKTTFRAEIARHN